MSRSYAAFASLSVFAFLLGTASIASAQVMPPQPAGAPVGGVVFFPPSWESSDGNCACYDSDSNINSGYAPDVASFTFSICYRAANGSPNSVDTYVVSTSIPDQAYPNCSVELVCGNPPNSSLVTTNDAGEVLYSRLQTGCGNGNCNLSPQTGWIGYQGPVPGINQNVTNVTYQNSADYDDLRSLTQLGGYYDWSNGTWSSKSTYPWQAQYHGSPAGYRLPFCTGTFTPRNLPALPSFMRTGPLVTAQVSKEPGILKPGTPPVLPGVKFSDSFESKTVVVKSDGLITYKTEYRRKAPVKKPVTKK